jgi:hypothetical protein
MSDDPAYETDYYAPVSSVADILMLATVYNVCVKVGEGASDHITFGYVDGKLSDRSFGGNGGMIFYQDHYEECNGDMRALLKLAYSKHPVTEVQLACDRHIPPTDFSAKYKVFTKKGSFDPVVALKRLSDAGVEMTMDVYSNGSGDNYRLVKLDGVPYGDQTGRDGFKGVMMCTWHGDIERRAYNHVKNLYHATFDK